MRKSILLSFIALFLFLPATIFAQTTRTRPTANPTNRVRAQERITIKARVLFETMIERFMAASNRLDRLSDRIEARITLLEEEIGELPALRENLAEAREHISLANESIEQAKAAFAEVDSADPKYPDFAEVKTFLTEAKNHLKEAHALLVDIITEIKGLRVGTLSPKPTRPVSPTVSPE